MNDLIIYRTMVLTITFIMISAGTGKFESASKSIQGFQISLPVLA